MILDQRLKTKVKLAITQLLVKWSGVPAELATWEDEDLVQRCLHPAMACGQAVIQDGGNVMVPGVWALKLCMPSCSVEDTKEADGTRTVRRSSGPSGTGSPTSILLGRTR